MSDRQWQRLEDAFRVWSFHVYYEKSFAGEPDPTLRFVKAIVASAQPIHDRRAVIAWHEKRKRRKHADAQAVSA